MNEGYQLSSTQQKFFDLLMRPESNWPEELRERFEERRVQINKFVPDLDKQVAAEFIRERIN